VRRVSFADWNGYLREEVDLQKPGRCNRFASFGELRIDISDSGWRWSNQTLSCMWQGFRLGLLVACGDRLNFASSRVKWSFGRNASRSLSLRAGHAVLPTPADTLRHGGRSRRQFSSQQGGNTINRSAGIMACHMRSACKSSLHLARLLRDENAGNGHLIYSDSHPLSDRELINLISGRLRVHKSKRISLTQGRRSRAFQPPVFTREPRNSCRCNKSKAMNCPVTLH
jgi:hypothetical protein